jgi:hypothetical protein
VKQRAQETFTAFNVPQEVSEKAINETDDEKQQDHTDQKTYQETHQNQ